MVLLNLPDLFSGKKRTLIKPFWDGLIIPVDQPGTVQPQEVSTSINFKGLSPLFENMKSYSTEPSSSLISPKLCSIFSKEIKGSEFRNEIATKMHKMHKIFLSFFPSFFKEIPFIALIFTDFQEF